MGLTRGDALGLLDRWALARDRESRLVDALAAAKAAWGDERDVAAMTALLAVARADEGRLRGEVVDAMTGKGG